MPWICPECNGDDLQVFYNERRTALIDHSFVEAVQPDYNNSDLVDTGGDISVHCNECGSAPIEAKWSDDIDDEEYEDEEDEEEDDVALP